MTVVMSDSRVLESGLPPADGQTMVSAGCSFMQVGKEPNSAFPSHDILEQQNGGVIYTNQLQLDEIARMDTNLTECLQCVS